MRSGEPLTHAQQTKREIMCMREEIGMLPGVRRKQWWENIVEFQLVTRYYSKGELCHDERGEGKHEFRSRGRIAE